jgi:hypothetical protein
MLWFTKAKRAQTDSDFETWNSGGGSANFELL